MKYYFSSFVPPVVSSLLYSFAWFSLFDYVLGQDICLFWSLIIYSKCKMRYNIKKSGPHRSLSMSDLESLLFRLLSSCLFF